MVRGGAVDEHDSGEQLPRWFGDYVLLKRLGRGGMGQVFLARLPGLAGIDRLCVIKTLRSQWTADREYVARFVDEARVVVHLNHRNICPVFDVGQVRSTYYLAMDLVPGRDLQAVWSRITARGGGPAVGLDVDVALFIVAEVPRGPRRRPPRPPPRRRHAPAARASGRVTAQRPRQLRRRGETHRLRSGPERPQA